VEVIGTKVVECGSADNGSESGDGSGGDNDGSAEKDADGGSGGAESEGSAENDAGSGSSGCFITASSFASRDTMVLLLSPF